MKTLEFKRDLSSPEGILKTLVQFANTVGGTVFIAVDDGPKNVRCPPDALAAEEKLASLVSDSLSPHLVPGHRGGRLLETERAEGSGLPQ